MVKPRCLLLLIGLLAVGCKPLDYVDLSPDGATEYVASAKGLVARSATRKTVLVPGKVDSVAANPNGKSLLVVRGKASSIFDLASNKMSKLPADFSNCEWIDGDEVVCQSTGHRWVAFDVVRQRAVKGWPESEKPRLKLPDGRYVVRKHDDELVVGDKTVAMLGENPESFAFDAVEGRIRWVELVVDKTDGFRVDLYLHTVSPLGGDAEKLRIGEPLGTFELSYPFVVRLSRSGRIGVWGAIDRSPPGMVARFVALNSKRPITGAETKELKRLEAAMRFDLVGYVHDIRGSAKEGITSRATQEIFRIENQGIRSPKLYADLRWSASGNALVLISPDQWVVKAPQPINPNGGP